MLICGLFTILQQQVRYDWSERYNGYQLSVPAGPRFGFVRFNIAGADAGRFAVYVYAPFEDPPGLFSIASEGNPTTDGTRLLILRT